MKFHVLKKLRSENRAFNEKNLIADMEISKITLRQHIHELQELGYPISETDKEYRLLNEPDVLFPWEFGKRESYIHYFTEVDSTMDVARKMAKNNCPHFTVIITEKQSKGRGRLKRKWISKKGGLYFTIVLKPELPMSLAHVVNFCASLSLAKILQHHFDLKARVKWPNDVLIDGKKISGLLSEMETDEDRIFFINIGIGINVNNDPRAEEPNATSLKVLLGNNVLRKTVLSLFLDEFERSLIRQHPKKIIEEWKNYSMTLGKEVRIVTNKETSQGTAMDVDESGSLILKLKDGSMKKIIYGDCFLM